MPYSVRTDDGIVVDGIPDHIDPGSEEVRQKVLQARAQRGGESPAPSQPEFNPSEGVGFGEAMAVMAGRGLTNIARGVGLADQEDPAVKKGMAQLREAQPTASMIGEVAGEAAPFLIPGLGAAALPSVGARVAATAGLGALEGALISRGKGNVLSETLLSAGIGGTVAGALELALPVIGRMGSALVSRILRKPPAGAVVDASGNPSSELVEALKASGSKFEDLTSAAVTELKGQVVDPAQASRKAMLESQGLTPTRAQVTRDAGDFQIQQEAAKTSSRAREAIEGQEAILSTRFDNAALEAAKGSDSPSASVVEHIVDKSTALDKRIGELYKAARDAAPEAKNIKLVGLGAKIKDLAPSDRASKGAIDAVFGDLKAKGVMDADFNVVGRIDVDTAEDVRKMMNSLYDPQEPFRNIKLRELKDSLDDDVFKAAGRDVYAEGRRAKRDFEKGLERAKVSKFDANKTNLVRDILENKIDPDKMADTVVFGRKYRTNDIQQLKDYMLQDEAGAKAFNALRGNTLEMIKSKSFIGPEDANGFKALSRDKLEKTINGIGRDKLSVLLEPKEMKFLDDMLKVSRLREPVRGTQQGRGPSAQAIAKLEEKLKAVPMLGALVDFIDIDSAGRAVLKASPKKARRDILTPQAQAAFAEARQPISLGGGAAAAGLIEEQQ